MNVTRRSFGCKVAAAAASVALGDSRAQGAMQFPDVLVLVPGIMGSVLRRNGGTVWGLDLQALLNALRSGGLDLRNLRTEAASSTAQAVEATALFETTTLIPGFWKVDGYTEARNWLVQQLALTPGSNYFDAPYDWRMDNRRSAASIAARCREWLGAWREKSKNGQARLVFVCHSMGGLVVQHACEVLGLHSSTRAVFTLGTPFQGSYISLARLVNGFVSEGLTKTVASFDSVYQLLPTYACIDAGMGMQTIAEVGDRLADKLDLKRYLSVGKDFHDQMHSATKANQGKSDNVLWHRTQSSTHRTATSGIWSPQGLSSQELWRGQPALGDGTVPGYNLAAPRVASKGMAQMHCNQLHGAIQNYEPALRNIVDTLKTGLLSGTKSSGDPVSLSFDDYLPSGGPLRVRLRFEKPVGNSAALLIDRVDRKTDQSRRPLEGLPTQQDFELTTVLRDPGVYRVSVEVRGDVLCSDLACVL